MIHARTPTSELPSRVTTSVKSQSSVAVGFELFINEITKRGSVVRVTIVNEASIKNKASVCVRSHYWEVLESMLLWLNRYNICLIWHGPARFR